MATTFDSPPKGGFANAIGEKTGMPPDGSDRQQVADPIKTENPKPVPVIEKVETAVVAPKPPSENSVLEPPPDLTNPNLVEKQKIEENPPVETEPARLKGMDDKAFTTWKKLHAERDGAVKERDAIKGEIEALRTQLSEASKTAPDVESIKKELADTKARLTEYEGVISVAKVEETKQFKDTITAPLAEISSSMQELAKRYEIPESSILEAIHEPDRAKRAEKISELIADFNELDKDDVKQAAREYARLNKEADSYRANAATKLQEIERETKAGEGKRIAQKSEAYRASAATEWNRLLSTDPTLKKVEGQKAWNDLLDAQGNEIASLDVNNISEAQIAKMAVAEKKLSHYEAATAHFKTQAATEREGRIAAETKLAAYLKTAPAAGGGRNGDHVAAPKTNSRFADDFPSERK